MLEIGVDTYIILENAETYLSANYASAELTFWDALEDSAKEILLRKAVKSIDGQRLAGRKANITQDLEFPRAIFSPTMFQYVTQTDIPTAVKYAQCEEALALLKGIPKRIELQRQGVKSFRLGDLAEEYNGNGNILNSSIATKLLKPYLAGGVSIC